MRIGLNAVPSQLESIEILWGVKWNEGIVCEGVRRGWNREAEWLIERERSLDRQKKKERKKCKGH